MNTQRLYTVADLESWLKITEASRAEKDAALGLQAVDDVVRFVSREMAKGLTLQQAGDRFMALSRTLQMPFAHTAAAHDALKQVGWQAE
ncbi:hypothetical protein ABIC89_005573 [Variovorax boronicumulans]|uniref:hypothetical protein n=1 Tax=Variovorax boronicumulans TaxID=436515 RepID=UPI00339AA872